MVANHSSTHPGRTRRPTPRCSLVAAIADVCRNDGLILRIQRCHHSFPSPALAADRRSAALRAPRRAIDLVAVTLKAGDFPARCRCALCVAGSGHARADRATTQSRGERIISRYVRNPIYVAVVAVILGQAVLFAD